MRKIRNHTPTSESTSHVSVWRLPVTDQWKTGMCQESGTPMTEDDLARLVRGDDWMRKEIL